ncbi:MAG: hypothetical protein HOK50_00235 [Kordiimonadaceae bacterium]|jgi:hypothetical protein|nr:hypothetical protein [Rhodospirillaceae bacterium]MBT6466073.1 hypothetical protein [Kordiimonadaceae bacterium]
MIGILVIVHDFTVPPVGALLNNAFMVSFCTWLETSNNDVRSGFLSMLVPLHVKGCPLKLDALLSLRRGSLQGRGK